MLEHHEIQGHGTFTVFKGNYVSQEFLVVLGKINKGRGPRSHQYRHAQKCLAQALKTKKALPGMLQNHVFRSWLKGIDTQNLENKVVGNE